MDIRDFLGHFDDIKPIGSNVYMVKCPTHEDKKASLKITNTSDSILVHCFAGCTTEAILANRGLQMSDLFHGKPSSKGVIETTYDYFDDDGNMTSQVVRRKGKHFTQRHLDTENKWVDNLIGVRRVLYRLPELIAQDPEVAVFVVEGEKDVETLRSFGFLATCNAGGGNVWFKHFDEYFNNRNVVIIGDNDKTGQEHAQDIKTHLRLVASSVRVLHLDGLKASGDVTDWFSEGHTGEELITAVMDVRPVAKPRPPRITHVTAVELNKMTFDPTLWIVEHLIPEGLTLIAGRPKSGKSWMCLDLAIAVASGGYTLGTIQVQQSEVLYIALEDNLKRLKRRLTKLRGEDPAPPGLDFYIHWERLGPHDGGLEDLLQWIDEHPKCKFIVIDNLSRIKEIPGKNLQLTDADTEALSGIQGLALERHIAVLMICHTRKAAAESELDALSGTLAIPAVADTTLILNHPSRSLKGEMTVTGRDVEGQKLALAWDPIACKWTILGNAEDIARSESTEAILAVLNQATEMMTPSEIAAATELKVAVVNMVLKRLLKAGEIEKPTRGKYRSAGMTAEEKSLFGKTDI